MSKFFILTGLLFLLFFSAKAQNLVLNPGFEAGPIDWATFSTDTPATNIRLEHTVVHSGSNSVAMTVRDTVAVSVGALQTVAILPGHSYLLSLFIKSDTVDGMAFPYINQGDTAKLLEYDIMPCNGTTGWHELQSRFIAAGNVTNITIFLLLSGVSGTAYFDDLSLTEVTDTSMYRYTVQIDSVTGVIRPFLSTNVGPVNGSSVDLSSQFRETGIDFVRTHDYYGPCDLHVIFPDTSRDPLDSTAYNFSSSDSVIGPIIQSGSQVLYRLGESFESPPVHNYPPADFIKTAQVFVQIAKHYNEGWNGGYHYNIRQWEIWNEPDGVGFWNGTAAQYAHFYNVVANALKQYDSTFILGGPALASVYSSVFLKTFLDSVRTNHAPLDFFSYHSYYEANPYHFAVLDSLVASTLQGYGYGNTPRYLTEWNNYQYNAGDDYFIWRDDPFSAASEISTHTYLQQTRLAKAFRYRCNEFFFGLWDAQGNFTYSGLALKTQTAFKSCSKMLATTGGDSLGRTILAGTNMPGDSFNIVVADNGSKSASYQIQLNGMASTDSFNYQLFRVDSTHLYQLVLSGGINGLSNRLSCETVAPFADQWILKRVSAPAAVAEIFASQVVCFPNPARDYVNFRIHENTATGILAIYNGQGQLVIQQSLSTVSGFSTAHIQTLACGTYSFTIRTDTNLYKGHFVKAEN